MEDTEIRSVCASTLAKCQSQTVRLIGRIIQPGQPGPSAKVQVYAGPGNPVTVTANLDSRIENLVEFIGTATSPTTMQADTYHVFSSEQADDFDLETYCEVLKFMDAHENPWNEGLM